MGKFANQTSVSVEKSRAEIESVLAKYGATHFAYAIGPNKAQIGFATKNRNVRFLLPLPDKNERRFQFSPAGRNRLSQEGQLKAWEQSCRQRWRALLLAIRAKLEAVDCGISTFEDEFMAFVVDPGTGKTVGEIMRPMIEARYSDPNSCKPLGLPAPE